MPRPTIDITLDLDSRDAKRALMVEVGSLRGIYEFKAEPRRDTHSNRLRRYYFGCVLECVRRGIEEAWGESLTKDECHVGMKAKFLSKPVADRNTGEVVMMTSRSITELDNAQMSAYVEEIIRFCGEFLGVIVPPADPDHDRPPQPTPTIGGSSDQF